jgi:hypothetical protein
MIQPDTASETGEKIVGVSQISARATKTTPVHMIQAAKSAASRPNIEAMREARAQGIGFPNKGLRAHLPESEA